MLDTLYALFNRTKKNTQEPPPLILNHREILETCADVRILLARRMIDDGSPEQKAFGEQAIIQAEKDRAYIPITIARRALSGIDTR